MKKIYLAGPDVFRQDAKEYGKFLKLLLASHGLEGLWPFDNENIPTDAGKPAMAFAIAEANMKMIRDCDGVLANLVPFRGPSVDPGTAFEIGYANALGKPVVGYNIQVAAYKHRLEMSGISGSEFPAIEDFDLPDNLMIIMGCKVSVSRGVDAAVQEMKTILLPKTV